MAFQYSKHCWHGDLPSIVDLEGEKVHSGVGVCLELRSEMATILTDKEYDYILLRMGIGGEGPYTTKEISKMAGVSVQAINQRIRKGIRKMARNDFLRQMAFQLCES